MANKTNDNTSANDRQSGLILRDLKFEQINLLHCKKATANYCRDLIQKQTEISLIQEPWIRGNKINGFGQLNNRLFYNRAGKRPRAAIHVSPNINAMILNQLSNDDLVAVRICRNAREGGDFVVISAYLPFDSKDAAPGLTLEKAVEFCKASNIPIIIGTDSNAHHKIWGSSNTNRRGEELVQYLLNTDLMVQNRGNRPTFVNAIRKEILDITLASCAISEQIHCWRVTSEETFSDKLIKFNLKGYFPQRKPFRNARRTNWDLFRQSLDAKLSYIDHKERYLTVESLEKQTKSVQPR